MFTNPLKQHYQIIDRISTIFQQLNQVESILLIGSLANKTADKYSNINIIIFSNKHLEKKQRKKTINQITENTYTNLKLTSNRDSYSLQNITVIIHYYTCQNIVNKIHQIFSKPNYKLLKMVNHIYQFKHGKILYDRHGWIEQIQTYLEHPYPVKLKEIIIKKHSAEINHKYAQTLSISQHRKHHHLIPKIKAQTINSINQIIYAYNQEFTPSPKNILNQAKNLKYLPLNFLTEINEFSESAPSDPKLTSKYKNIIYNLNRMLSLQQYSTYKPNFLQYIASLPERLFRTTIIVIFAPIYELTELLIPNFISKSKIYQSTISRSFQLVLTVLGKVEGLMLSEQSSGTQLMIRKTLGNIIEYGSMAAIGFSPLWILAIMADITGGTKTYLDEFVKQLKHLKILDKQTQIENVSQLFTILENISSHSAEVIDLPPLTIQQLKKSYQQYQQQSEQLPDQNQLDEIYTQLKSNSQQENRSITELSWIIALSAQKAGIQIGKSYILNYYQTTLQQIKDQGLHNFIINTIKPYRTAIYYHLHPASLTWSEKYLVQQNKKNKLH